MLIELKKNIEHHDITEMSDEELQTEFQYLEDQVDLIHIGLANGPFKIANNNPHDYEKIYGQQIKAYADYMARLWAVAQELKERGVGYGVTVLAL